MGSGNGGETTLLSAYAYQFYNGVECEIRKGEKWNPVTVTIFFSREKTDYDY